MKRGGPEFGALRRSERDVRGLILGIICLCGCAPYLLRERLHGVPLDGRAGRLAGGVLLRLDPTQHLEPLEVFGFELGDRGVFEVARLHDVREHAELAVLLVEPAAALALLVAETFEELGAVVGAALAIVDDLDGAAELRVECERGFVALAGDGEGLDVLLDVDEPDVGPKDVQDRRAGGPVVLLARKRHVSHLPFTVVARYTPNATTKAYCVRELDAGVMMMGQGAPPSCARARDPPLPKGLAGSLFIDRRTINFDGTFCGAPCQPMVHLVEQRCIVVVSGLGIPGTER